MQARSVAPTIHRGTLKEIEKDSAALRMITVRHPFHRWISALSVVTVCQQFHHLYILFLILFIIISFRLLSAFRDKLERCTTDFDCTGNRKDW